MCYIYLHNLPRQIYSPLLHTVLGIKKEHDFSILVLLASIVVHCNTVLDILKSVWNHFICCLCTEVEIYYIKI